MTYSALWSCGIRHVLYSHVQIHVHAKMYHVLSLGKHLLYTMYHSFLQITRTEVLYWKVDEPKNFSADRFPVFKHTGGSGGRNDMFYGLPALEYPGLLKVLCV